MTDSVENNPEQVALGKDPATGQFIAGNKFWLIRSSHGRTPIFATPDDLWNASVEYFEWADSNPLQEAKPFAFQGIVTIAKLDKMRAMTIAGLCLFLDINTDTWQEYKGKTDFSVVTSKIENVIKSQKFAGAAADLLNANIIARDLGLSDKVFNEHSGPNGGPIKTINANVDVNNMTPEVLDALEKALLLIETPMEGGEEE